MKRLLFLVPCGLALCALNVTAAVAQELPQPIEETVVAQPALLDQLRAGTMTAEQAWDKKLLDEKGVLDLLQNGSLSDERQESLRASLAGLLIRYAPDRVKDEAGLSRPLKWALGDYYASIGNERGAALYEMVLKEMPRDSLYLQGLLLKSLGKLWSKLRKLEQAEAAYLRGRQVLSGKEPLFAAEMMLWLARMWAQAGKMDKAKLVYAQVAKEGDNVMAGLAAFDQARFLIGQGEHAEARKLLIGAIAGNSADRVKMAQLSLLGSSFYRTGEFETARKYSQQAIERFNALPKEQQGKDFNATFNMAKDTLRSIEQWTKEPILLEPREIRLNVDHERNKPLIRRLSVRTFQDVPLVVSSDNPLVKVRVLTGDEWGDETTSARKSDSEKEVIVEIAPEALQKATSATLLVSSPKLGRFQAPVSLRVEAR